MSDVVILNFWRIVFALVCTPTLVGYSQQRLSQSEVRDVFSAALLREPFLDKEFIYRCKTGGAFGIHNEIRKFRVRRPAEPGSIVFRLYWSAEIQNPGEPHLRNEELVRIMEAFDGTKSRVFRRTLISETAERGFYIDNEAVVFPGFHLPNAIEDRFCLYLMTGIEGVQPFSPGRDLAKLIRENDFGVVVATAVDSGLGIPAIQLENRVGEDYVTQTVSRGPEFLMLHEKYKTSDLNYEFVVSELIEVAGVVYPAKCTFSKDFNGQHWDSSFELISVKPDHSKISEWFTWLPSGSVEMDQVEGSLRKVPYSDEQMSDIESYVAKIAPALAPVRTWNSRGLILVLNLAIFVLIVLCCAWVRFRRKRSEQ